MGVVGGVSGVKGVYPVSGKAGNRVGTRWRELVPPYDSANAPVSRGRPRGNGIAAINGVVLPGSRGLE